MGKNLTLNQISLLVLPSLTDGLSVIILYAMACGAVTLATPVGGVPDVIADGETGFLMADGSPECIAATVSRALRHLDLNGMAANARRLVMTEYGYEACVARLRNALARLLSSPNR